MYGNDVAMMAKQSAMGQLSPSETSQYQRPTLRAQLQAKADNLKAQLTEVEKALEFFEKYPEMEEGINLLGRAL